MEIYKEKEYIDKTCNKCNRKTCHTYLNIDKMVPKGNPDILIQCASCGGTQHITEKEWVMNCYFDKIWR